jgi:hypothetical protein
LCKQQRPIFRTSHQGGMMVTLVCEFMSCLGTSHRRGMMVTLVCEAPSTYKG